MGAKETGKSLILSVLAIWYMLFTNLKTIGIIAGSEDQAKVTYAHLRRLLLTGSHVSQLLVEEPTAITCRLTNGGEVWVYAASFYRAHGRHPHIIVGDEAVLASKAQDGEVLKGALASVTTGGRRIMASAPYYWDTVFMPTWEKASELGYRRYGPWRKHPWQELSLNHALLKTPVNRRPWIPVDIQVKEATRMINNPLSNYRVFWIGEPEAGVGDIFPPEKVEACVDNYLLDTIIGCRKALGVDTGFGSSMFGIVGLEERDQKLYVTVAEDYERPSFNDMAQAIANLYHNEHYDAVLVDASNPAFIEELKARHVYVEPVVFSRELSSILSATTFHIERGGIRVHEDFTDLIWQLKNAKWDKSGRKVDKTGASSYDLVDALICAIKYWVEGRKEPVIA